MPNPLVLPIGPGLSFKEGLVVSKVTDHNRSELSVSPDRIENKKRMADGTLRTFFVAQKRTFKTSWEELPRDDNQTADGFMGAQSMKDFYDNHRGSFEIVLTRADNTTETVLVMFDSFSYKLNKRSRYTELYDVEMSLMEV
jgi:hypothetical protein